jgi:hypothetical protein
MVLVWPTAEDNIEAQERDRKYQFYRETIEDVYRMFDNDNEEWIATLEKHLADDEFFKTVQWAYWRLPWEEALFITEGKFYIFWDEFSEEDIRRICQAFYGEDDLDFIMNLSASLEATDDSRTSIFERMWFFFSNFPGNMITWILWEKRGEIIVWDHLVIPDKKDKNDS